MHMTETMTSQFSREEIKRTLKSVFGFSEFRDNQEHIITAILQGQDLFASMPTGGGKSLCYQLPAYLLKGACIVISPLISLMKDQVDAAKATGLRAACINSTLPAFEIHAVYEKLQNLELDILYIAPERFAAAGFTAMLKKTPLSMFAVDEAHCISEWGHDFRPDYLLLSDLKKEFPGVPVTAFTASATEDVQRDIIQKLNLHKPVEVRASFNRPNLFYHVVKKTAAHYQILEYIQQHPREQGIVYRTTRQDVDNTCEFLVRAGIKALPYHAGLDNSIRKSNQDAFNRDEVDVVVATVAFGMGIDKSNIRFVIHGDIPKNIESYYQETGRSGRDGGPSRCVLLYSWSDIHKIRYFINAMDDTAQKTIAEKKLNEMIRYASTNTCRRKYILNYFGEVFSGENCNTCDTCTGTTERIDATVDARIILSAIARTGGRFGAGHIVDIVKGANTEKIRRLGHDTIKTYGKGKDKDKNYWRSVIDELLSQEFLAHSDDIYPTLKLLPGARPILKGNDNFYIIEKDEPDNDKTPFQGSACNEALFQQLRTVRKNIADEKGVPPFVVFSDMSLKEMSSYYPVTENEFLLINGVGRVKLHDYGESFLNKIRLFLEENPDINRDTNPRKRAKPRQSPGIKKSQTIDVTGELLAQGFTCAEIAETRGLTPSTIAGHIEKLIMRGHDIDINRHIQSEKKSMIEEIFTKLQTSSLRAVVDASKGMVDFDEARLVRAHLQKNNEYKNQ